MRVRISKTKQRCRCAHRKNIWGVDSCTQSFLTSLLERSEWSCSTYDRFTGGNVLRCPFDRRPYGSRSQSESLEEIKNIFLPPEMDPLFFGFPASSLVTILSELTRLPYLSTSNTKFPFLILFRSLKPLFH